MTLISQVREAVTLILRAYMHADTSEEREQIAREVSRLDHGGARSELADLAEQALKEQP